MNNNKNESWHSRRDYISGLITKLNSRKKYLQKISGRYSNLRLSLFLIEVVIFFIFFFYVSNTASIISLIIFLVVFSIIAHNHSKLVTGIKQLDVWIKIKEAHLARLNLDWEKIPLPDNLAGKPGMNEIDLDLTGNESLFQLINTGTAKQSKLMLNEWLTSKNHNADEIIERQQLVKELIPLTAFRDKLTLKSISFSKIEFDGEILEKLLDKNESPKKSLKIIFLFLSVLAPLNILFYFLYYFDLMPAYWAISTVIYVLVFMYGNKDKSKFAEFEIIADQLGKISTVFGFIEKYPYNKGSKLQGMCRPFWENKQQPSFLIDKIRNSVEMLRMKKANPYVWLIISAVYPADIYYNLKLKKYKNLVKENFDTWLNTWYKLETLCSLANFAHLNPGFTFPEIIDNSENKIVFRAKQLGHPLIQNDKRVCNNFSFDPAGEIAVITGSNMSGKSTFIRALGINLSLAYAGSTVNADKLEVSLFDLFTCIRVNDSVKDGISFFYAEVKRLKALLDEIEISRYPVFFLIDEIFRGTNNIERLKGSSMFIKKLSGTSAVGAIATHDLELAKLSDEIYKLRNYHFKEEILNGKMVFDYLINDGPCPTTNALKIMKLEGLPVEE